MSVKFQENSKSKYLTAEQIAEFGEKVDAIRREIMDSIGEKDAEYIYKIRDFVRYSEIASRSMLMFGGWIPPVWLLGTGLLGISKIVENMELGHNVMHGQFDWLNDPTLNGANYDWDTMATGDDWKHTHNYIHHTYTNIPGHDEDIEVAPGLVRLSPEEKLRPHMKYQHLYAIPLYGLASLSWALRKDYVKFFQKKIGETPNTHKPWDYVSLFLFKGIFYGIL